MKHMTAFLLFVFATQSVLAEYTCDTSVSDYYATYEKDSFTCSSGQYLPADGLACATCPTGFTCNGGTFDFDSDSFQGLDFSAIPTTQMNNVCAINFPNGLFAVYEPNSYACNPGYYLPADAIACVQCPLNNACVGGTYTFNERISQGIQSCASGTFSPTGSSVCYPHILHVGDSNVYLKSTKQTTPSLNIRIGNDVFYANMTTVRTRMNKDSSHYFHVQWDNNDYYVCDDTMCPQ